MTFETDASGHCWLVIPYKALNESIAGLQSHFGRIDAERRTGRIVSGLKLKVPAELGRGSWWLVRSSPHMFVLTANVEYRKDEHVRVSGDQMAKTRIVLSGALHQIDADIRIDGTGAFVEAFPEHTASEYRIAGGKETRLTILNAYPAALTETLDLALDDIPAPISQVFDAEADRSAGGIAALGPDILRAASDIYNASRTFTPPLFRPFVNAKSHELLCSILQDLGRRTEGSGSGVKFTLRDMRRVDEARTLLIDAFRQPPTIPELARKVGINQTKLKAMFKAAYGTTIYEFVQKQRMERALELLAAPDLSISEIAYEVGYDYPASFTHAFAREFGHSPKEARLAAQVSTKA